VVGESVGDVQCEDILLSEGTWQGLNVRKGRAPAYKDVCALRGKACLGKNA
jgi:hypothetical protein